MTQRDDWHSGTDQDLSQSSWTFIDKRQEVLLILSPRASRLPDFNMKSTVKEIAITLSQGVQADPYLRLHDWQSAPKMKSEAEVHDPWKFLGEEKKE